MASSFNYVSLLHVSRSCNVVAHKLAQVGIGFDQDVSLVWLENYPAYVTDLVASDLSLSTS